MEDEPDVAFLCVAPWPTADPHSPCNSALGLDSGLVCHVSRGGFRGDGVIQLKVKLQTAPGSQLVKKCCFGSTQEAKFEGLRFVFFKSRAQHVFAS